MFRSNSTFDKLIEKATSNLLLEPDWNSILTICDYIRQGDVQPKYALNAIKKKMYATNPHVNLYALQILESCMKNCGSSFHFEVGTKSFMEELRELVKVTSDEKVREKLLELIQAWAHAFRKEPSFRIIQDTFNAMKAEGHQFPPLKETEAMFAADSAPQWADGDCCHRCRVQFNLVQRKHHCRHCGQIFCAKCSSKQSIIPKYGLEKEVRVCEDCFEKLSKPTDPKTKISTPFSRYSESKEPEPSNAKPTMSKTEQELQEEEDLQMAIALSKSEAESKEKTRIPVTDYSSYSQIISNPIIKTEKTHKMGADVEKYLDRSFWETKLLNSKRSTSPAPSAPSPHYNIVTTKSGPEIEEEPKLNAMANKQENGIESDIDSFLSHLKSGIEMFVNRMNSNHVRGRPIANDTSVQTLFLSITNMHSQLLRYIQDQDDGRLYYEGLQDKLGQIRDARAALDALREEHQEKLRLEAEEAERQRQAQMAQKLEIMRKKKNEYLQYQRQMALQRIQEQEREMLIRQEQQKYQWPQGPGVPSTPQYPTQTGPIAYAAPTIGSQPPQPPQGSVIYQPPLNHGPPSMGPSPLTQQPVTSSPSRSTYINPQGQMPTPIYQIPQPPYGTSYAPMVGPGVQPVMPMVTSLPPLGPDHSQLPPQQQQLQPPQVPQPQQQQLTQDTYNSNNQPSIEEPLISFD